MPEPLDYLVSTAGTAYLVVGVAEGRTRFHYTLERVALVPHDAPNVYEFFWLSRAPQGPSRRRPGD
jgi:hypothetical protein